MARPPSGSLAGFRPGRDDERGVAVAFEGAERTFKKRCMVMLAWGHRRTICKDCVGAAESYYGERVNRVSASDVSASLPPSLQHGHRDSELTSVT